VPGATLSSNDEVFADHERYVHAARGRSLVPSPSSSRPE
jgi:hypothetical protein